MILFGCVSESSKQQKFVAENIPQIENKTNQTKNNNTTNTNISTTNITNKKENETLPENFEEINENKLIEEDLPIFQEEIFNEGTIEQNETTGKNQQNQTNLNNQISGTEDLEELPFFDETLFE